MKKILLVSHEMTYTGAPRSLLFMAIALRELGFQVSISSLYDGEFVNEFNAQKFDVTIYTNQWDKYVDEISQYDLVIANTIFTLPFAYHLQKFAKVILVLREANNIKEIASNCSIDDNLLYKIENIWCVSEYARVCIQKLYGIDNIKVLHNYVLSNKNFKFNVKTDEKIHFIVSGTIEERKQQHVVIEAFKRMPKCLHDNTQLHIVGKNPEWARQYWTEFINDTDRRIIFHGEISDENERLSLYSKMNVFIIPSKDESCSLVALEGAMLGKALLISNHVGARYLLNDDNNIFNVGDVEMLSRKMSMMTSRRLILFEGIKMFCNFKKSSTKRKYKKNIFNLLNQYL